MMTNFLKLKISFIFWFIIHNFIERMNLKSKYWTILHSKILLIEIPLFKFLSIMYCDILI